MGLEPQKLMIYLGARTRPALVAVRGQGEDVETR